jgi:hypothetical protein
MCHGGKPLPSASWDGTGTDPMCRCVGVPLRASLPSRARAHRTQHPNIKEGNERPKQPSQHALARGDDITAWKAEKSITVRLEVLPRAVSDAICSNRDFWASLDL